MKFKKPNHPEPVPELSQLLAMTFLSSVVGHLASRSPSSPFRVTLHRGVERAGTGYLQQVCPYAERIQGDDGVMRTEIRTRGEGRFFPVDSGIMGKAFQTRKIWRTRHYLALAELERDLIEARARVGEAPSLDAAPARSWVAIPFVFKVDATIIVLFGESVEPNFFASNEVVSSILAMAVGLAALLDSLELSPLRRIRNFPIVQAPPALGGSGVYNVHEEFSEAPPLLTKASSFNFEFSTV